MFTSPKLGVVQIMTISMEISGKIVEDKKKAINVKDNKLKETKTNKNDDDPGGVIK